MRVHSVSPKLNGQSVGKGGLTGRGRACDQNEFHVFAVYDLLGDLPDPSLLKRLLNQDHIADLSLADGIIQISHTVYAHHLSPFRGGFQGLKEFFPGFKEIQLCGIFPVGN